MTHERVADAVWIALMLLTLLGAWLGESGAVSGWVLTLFVAAVIGIKGKLVIDHYMELRGANRSIHRWMSAYFVVMPALVILVWLAGEHIARWTTIN